MRIDWQRHSVVFHEDDVRLFREMFADNIEIINLDTGEDVGKEATWADDRLGQYEEFLRNEKGQFYLVNEDDGLPYTDEWEREGKTPVIATRVVQANIKIQRKDAAGG